MFGLRQLAKTRLRQRRITRLFQNRNFISRRSMSLIQWSKRKPINRPMNRAARLIQQKATWMPAKAQGVAFNGQQPVIQKRGGRSVAAIGLVGSHLPASARRLLQWRQIPRRGQYGRLPTRTLNTDSGLWRGVGMRLVDGLRPNRERRDLFDKEYRRYIVQKYVIANGGLKNIGPNLKQASAQAESEISWPDRMKPIFAISIRPTRFENLRARLGPWEKFLVRWQGTNGEILDKRRMVADGTAVARLKRGEIGCYDAHYRLWKHISDNNIPHALILEDDADLNYGHYATDRIQKMFDGLQRQNIHYDLVYVGHNKRHPSKKTVSGIGMPGGTQGLFMYYVTLEGAKKLILGAIPMRQAVDDYVYMNKSIRQFTLEPPLGYVVDIERSDTANIH